MLRIPTKAALGVVLACLVLGAMAAPAGAAGAAGSAPAAGSVAAAGVSAISAVSAAVGFQFGLADYEPATFSDPRVAELGVRNARDVVPWNVVAVPRDLAAVSAWLAAVKQAGITPLITFQHADGNDRAPTQAQFLKDFLRFRALFGWVSEFCPWDEATHAGQPTARHPRLAAQYYNAIASHCPGCMVTAPDTLDADGNIERWIGQFLRSAHPYPKIWPLNPYISVSTDNSRAIRRLLSFVHGQVWFSEVGGIVWWRFHGKLIYHGVVYAAKVAKNIFKLAAISPRITRVYYYHWRSPGTPQAAKKSTWDAGLVSASGVARPALLVVAKALHRQLQTTTPSSY
jgi:hypothetical protein